MNKMLVEQIDSILPQTQCELCQYPGCKPYAEAIVKGEAAINQCLSGGVTTLKQLGALLKQDVSAMLDEMQQRQQPSQVAVIREEECIGCTKCIPACPVDAIVGSNKQMHTVIAKDCTGCELCIAPCPMDCIDLVSITEPNAQQRTDNQTRNRERYSAHLNRLNQLTIEEDSQYQQAKLTLDDRKAEIQAAIQRTKQSQTTYEQ